jgi:hypothetical protein
MFSATTSKGDRVSGFDIFLSYSREDRAAARIFAECFVHEGFSVWWDASLHSGETFDEVIEKELRDAKAVVVLWSPRSVASRWVRAEATQADRRGKLAPAIIEPCDRPIIFELTHAAELSGWNGDTTDVRWRIFMEDLRRLVGAGTGHEGSAPARQATRPQPSRSNGTGDVSSRAPEASRRPIRPGSDEVILAGRRTHEPSIQQSPHAAELRSQHPAEVDAHAVVHCLEIEDGELGEDLFVIGSSGVKIGRTAPADIVLSHKSVSREHCIIGLANDELLVTDLSSTNGTYIDGQRIARATILPVGSVVRIGQISLKHAIHARAEAEGRSGLRKTNREGGLQAGRLAATS